MIINYNFVSLPLHNTFPPVLLQINARAPLEIIFSQRLMFIRHILFHHFHTLKWSPLQSIFNFRSKIILRGLYLGEIMEVFEAVQCCAWPKTRNRKRHPRSSFSDGCKDFGTILAETRLIFEFPVFFYWTYPKRRL